MDKSKTAIVTGATGQDGSYLCELLLEKPEYNEIRCIVRSSSYSISNSNIKHIIKNDKLKIYNSNILDLSSLSDVFENIHSDVIEVYNLAAYSQVGVTFKCPHITLETNTMGTTNLLQTIIHKKILHKVRFYQASTSEMFGKVKEVPQNENTLFYPRSPYGVSKLAAHWLIINYRETYNMFACSGILFNHESPRRGDYFVTKKIVNGIRDIKLNKLDCLSLGNLNSLRDWGHAKDYVKAMWLMLQQEVPCDYVVASGENYSVRDFVNVVLKENGIQYKWEGSDVDEICIDTKSNKTIIKIDQDLFRPCEVDILLGDPSNIKNIGWVQEFSFEDLIKDMIEYS